MNCYVDSSAVLRNIFNADHAFKEYGQFDKIGSSELLIIECNRVIDRYRLEKMLNDDQIAAAKENLKFITDGMHIIGISDPVKLRARDSFPTIIGTLDAIHISTALIWKEFEKVESVTVISHDKQINTCARALGLITVE